MIFAEKVRLGSETGRVKNTEESEDQDFSKVLQNEAKKKELKVSTAEIYSGRAFRNPEDATEVVRRFRKKAAGFSKDRECFMDIAKLFSK